MNEIKSVAVKTGEKLVLDEGWASIIDTGAVRKGATGAEPVFRFFSGALEVTYLMPMGVAKNGNPMRRVRTLAQDGSEHWLNLFLSVEQLEAVQVTGVYQFAGGYREATLREDAFGQMQPVAPGYLASALYVLGLPEVKEETDVEAGA
jgi:hypothetical protein